MPGIRDNMKKGHNYRQETSSFSPVVEIIKKDINSDQHTEEGVGEKRKTPRK